MMKKVFLLSFLILAFTSKAFSASMSMIGEKGDPNNVDRTINIKMYDNYYEPNSIKVKKGETIKFIVQNLGEMVHEYNIATKEMHIKHQPEMEKMVEHEILLVDKIDMDKVNNIDFFFSIGSTYTYLSVTRILEVEKKNQVKFTWKPFSVRAIMKEMNNIPFPKDKLNKVNYMWRDIERRAEGYGFFAKTPVPYPLSEFDLANQIAILGLEKGWGIDYVRLTYKKWFQEGKEPAIDPSITEVCRELNIDKDEIISQANSKEIINNYNLNTNSARDNKIFGSPSFVVKNEIFWGDDRMEDAVNWSNK